MGTAQGVGFNSPGQEPSSSLFDAEVRDFVTTAGKKACPSPTFTQAVGGFASNEQGGVHLRCHSPRGIDASEGAFSSIRDAFSQIGTGESGFIRKIRSTLKRGESRRPGASAGIGRLRPTFLPVQPDQFTWSRHRSAAKQIALPNWRRSCIRGCRDPAESDGRRQTRAKMSRRRRRRRADALQIAARSEDGHAAARRAGPSARCHP